MDGGGVETIQAALSNPGWICVVRAAPWVGKWERAAFQIHPQRKIRQGIEVTRTFSLGAELLQLQVKTLASPGSKMAQGAI